jgi:ubiquinone/menaquinone biosynthesis C-methylase UbiE
MASEWDRHFNLEKIDHGIMQVWARYFVDSYQKYLGFSKNDVVLDFGAGLGDVSSLIEDKVERIYLFDKSEFFLDQMKHRFGAFPHMQVVDSLQQVKEPVSLIIINGVIHYMKEKEITDMLVQLQHLSDSKTRIIISDIVPPGYSKVVDGFSQLVTGLRKKFFKKLLTYIVSNIWDDPKLSLKTSSFYFYDEHELNRTLSEFGYSARKMESNFSYSKYRYTLNCARSGN